ncbi:TetR/AcrR family transcriptional regulator [Granulicella arctica]|uniref:TetR/AcrR family transcriptional regulator n=1 Tax=Granulicella arctica TaxID=940613 RepID=UPI0021E04992|nr:TetR/AcrR family transcriptional regulator [Granulicella arctica]
MPVVKVAKSGLLRSTQEERLLAAATEVFLDKGFSATSMDEIAGAAKASKITFYNHFGNKDELFETVILRLNERIDARFAAALEGDISVEKGLVSFARLMMTVLYSGESIRLLRVLHSESERFPHLGHIFEKAGPERGRKLLTGFILKKMEAGKLRKLDPELAAEQFMHLALGELARLLLLGLATPSKEQVERRLNSAVDVFQRAYGA